MKNNDYNTRADDYYSTIRLGNADGIIRGRVPRRNKRGQVVIVKVAGCARCLYNNNNTPTAHALTTVVTAAGPIFDDRFNNFSYCYSGTRAQCRGQDL